MNITIHNVETGEVSTRPMTKDELDREAQVAKNYQIFLSEQEAKATAKAALLEKLGITEDEARLLLG